MEARAKAEEWLQSKIDDDSRSEIEALLNDADSSKLTEAFYKDLEFGTGGLRGIMGVGSNRMNKYTVGMATQGLCNYLKKEKPNRQLSVAIAYDSRNNSSYFAECVASVFSGNGTKVFLFDSLRPTPELSFAIRHLKCDSGVVLTASHNPKEYNGYKAYWDDGSQLIAPHDKNVIDEVKLITGIDEVIWEPNQDLVEYVGQEIDEAYISEVLNQSLTKPDSREDLSVLYSPIHGTGYKMVPKALKEAGFTRVEVLQSQSTPDGNFPTVVYPNPEEKEALSLALNRAEGIGAELVMATDPDADRVGIAVRNLDGQFELLNGNQTAALLMHYLLKRRQANGSSPADAYIAKTIVTTDLIEHMCSNFDVNCYNTLTGFKYIAQVIREKSGEEHFLAGCEESYGYMIGDFVRDKDAVTASFLIAELAAEAKDRGSSVYEELIDIYLTYGYYLEDLVSITRTGKDGIEEIGTMMHGYRTTPPASIANSKVIKIIDYLEQTDRDLISGTTSEVLLPKSNVLQFLTEDGSKISMRPSGTEPKIKFYFSVNAPLSGRAELDAVSNQLKERITDIKRDLDL